MISSPILAASLLPPSVEHTDEVILEAMKKLRYPVIVSLKKDGIRALKTEKWLVSRKLKLIPNISIQRRAQILPYGFDMELWNSSLAYNEIESIVMSEEHERSDMIQFHLLDDADFPAEYHFRLNLISEWISHHKCPSVIYSSPTYCYDANELLQFFLKTEQENGEGICFRTPDSPYKQGRSTLKQQYLVKLSRYVRTEAVIIDFNEARLNSNAEKRDPTGLMKRQTLSSGMMGKDTLGSFECINEKKEQFSVSCGVLTASERQFIWDNQDKYKGKTMTIKHKPYGALNAPRNPSFVGWREEGF